MEYKAIVRLNELNEGLTQSIGNIVAVISQQELLIKIVSESKHVDSFKNFISEIEKSIKNYKNQIKELDRKRKAIEEFLKDIADDENKKQAVQKFANILENELKGFN